MLDMINFKKNILEFKKKLLELNIKKNFNIPNILTFVRIILIIPFSINLLEEKYIKACEILIFSGITDFLDGFFARILNQKTKLGEILDPVADKLTLIAIMICLRIKKTKKTIRAKWYGKLATVFFYFSIALIVSFKALWDIESEFLINILMFLTSLLMFYAMIKYFLEFLSIMHNRKSRNN